MMRLILFFGTNIAVLAVATIAFKIFGVEDLIAQSGAQINLTGLLIFSGIVGFAGSFI